MPSAPANDHHAFWGTNDDARRCTRTSLIANGAIYALFGAAIGGWLPFWAFACVAPVLVVRWMLSVHELFHLKTEREVDPITRLLPLMLTPLSLGYREFLEIHRGHHRHMATREDPEYFQLRGDPLTGLANAMTAPEQAFFRWIARRGVDRALVGGIVIRVALFAGLVAASGAAFWWYWVPVRLGFGASYFAFFYCLHRRGPEYGVYRLALPAGLDRMFRALFGRDAVMAMCHHDVHHSYPRVAAGHLDRLSLR